MNKSIALFSLLLLSACATTPQTSSRYDTQLNDLAFYAMSLDGTPYQWGGETPGSGFDCSGFVRHVFMHELGVVLPRTSREMSHVGESVDYNNLEPGDLVFFNTNKHSTSHVGIYLGESRFIHAPRVGESIRVDLLNNDYWRVHFSGARRVTT